MFNKKEWSIQKVAFLFAFFLGTGFVHGQVVSPTSIPTDLPEVYQNAERNAPETARLDLQNLREQAKQKGWKFKIGYTRAFASPLDQLAGTRIPGNFLAIAIAQNDFAAKANGAADESARLAGIQQPKYLGQCKPDKKAFNWRDENMVSKVEFQGTCGSCWAFTAASTYNVAYKIRNGEEIGVSEQHILDCAVGNDGKRAGTCAGGWYDPAFQWMIRKGVASETSLSYVGTEQACTINTPGQYRAVSWGFVTSKNEIPLISEIKDAVCQYGAVSTAMEATPAFQAYAGGYFNEGSNGTINHAVTIVGWDDNAGGEGQGAWLVKNSWSERWGEEGYVWIAYRTNKIGYASAYVRPTEPKIPTPTQALSVAWNQALPNFRIAAQLAGVENEVAPQTAAPPRLLPFQAKVDKGNELINQGKKKVVWIQYGASNQRKEAESLRQTLTNAGYFAPAVEDVTKKGGKLPDVFQVRYFNSSNKKSAIAIAKILQNAGIESVRVVKPKISVSTDAIEIWFPSA